MTETAINDNQPPAAIAWPKHPPSATQLIRYATGRAQWLNGAGWVYVEHEMDDDLLRSWHVSCITQQTHLHDIALLLKNMQEISPRRADELAEWIWRAADAGDSYGEWIWQWAKDSGHDPDALYEAGQEAARQRITAARERPASPVDDGRERAT